MNKKEFVVLGNRFFGDLILCSCSFVLFQSSRLKLEWFLFRGWPVVSFGDPLLFSTIHLAKFRMTKDGRSVVCGSVVINCCL